MIKLSEWRFSFEVAWDDLWFRLQTIMTALAFFIGAFFVLRRLVPIGMRSSLLVFHYNPYLGIDEVQPWTMLFVYLFIFFMVLVINFILSFQLFRHDRIASRVLLVGSTLFTTLLIINAYFISSVNN